MNISDSHICKIFLAHFTLPSRHTYCIYEEDNRYVISIKNFNASWNKLSFPFTT